MRSLGRLLKVRTKNKVTIFEALNKGAEVLKTTQPEKHQAPGNPKLDAQVLLSYLIKKPSSYLFAHGEEIISQDVERAYLELIERRAKHEPVAYITGEKEFFGRAFKVTSATLVPRPETELLVERALEGAGFAPVFADIGTGSGAIAVTLAAQSGGFVFATDISKDAIEVAKMNAATHGVSERIFFLEGDLLLPFLQDLQAWMRRAELKALTIVANLPYISRRQYENLDPDVKNFEPQTALLSGIDGLDHYDRMLQQLKTARASFPAQLKLLMEIDPSQAFSAERLIRHFFPQAKVQIIKDLSNKARILETFIP